MPLGTCLAQRAKSTIIMWARRHAALRVDVEVKALLAVGAVSIPCEEVAFRHFPQVVLVKKLALLALFTKTTQPVLADKRI